LQFRQLAAGTEPLRVGVVVDRATGASRWIHATIEFLRGIAGLKLCALGAPGPAQGKPALPGWIMDRLYTASRRKFDPYSDVGWTGSGWQSVDLITPGMASSSRCDVLIWLASSRVVGTNLPDLSRFGIFTVHLGRHPQDAIPFWSETAASEPTTEMRIIWHDTNFDTGRVVRCAETATVLGLYFTENGEGPLIAAMQMLASLCLGLHEDGAGCVERFRSLPAQPVLWLGPARCPSTVATGGFVARKLARTAYLRWKARGSDPKWFVAARPNKGVSIADGGQLSGFKPIDLPQGSDSMADPFLLDRDGRTWLLFEETRPGVASGRLACVELRENGSCGGMEIVLERDGHLSYPCVVPNRNELFLLPESAGARRVDLYRFSRFPGEVELVATLAEDFPAVDTTPVFLEDRWYFFTTTPHPFMETLLFWSDRLDGCWHLHPSSPVSGSVRNSRSAGNLFWRNGRLFRPTQDCSVRYGYAITLNEILRLTPAGFEERRVQWAPPAWMPGLLGTHTWNESSRWQVLDGLGDGIGSKPGLAGRRTFGNTGQEETDIAGRPI
jgi:hypothetical protein